jgi:hypothetical protein
VIFGNSRSRKKKRRIEVLFELLKKLILEGKFEENKIYKMVDKESLKQLINYASRKKRKRFEVTLLKEKKEEFIKEKVCKNWKNKRKKPPDKVVEVEIVSLNLREMNQLRNEVKNFRKIVRKGRKSNILEERKLLR